MHALPNTEPNSDFPTFILIPFPDCSFSECKCSEGLKLEENLQRCYQMMKRIPGWKMTMSIVTPCAENVESTILLMNSGSVVMYATGGSMAYVWRSLQPELSTWRCTNVQHAALKRKSGLDEFCYWGGLTSNPRCNVLASCRLCQLLSWSDFIQTMYALSVPHGHVKLPIDILKLPIDSLNTELYLAQW